MNYLSDYTGPLITAALNRAGAFFAFSDQQFQEQRDPLRDNLTYRSLGAGLICPKENAAALMAEIEAAAKAGREQDVKENGRAGVIRRELANHECTYSGSAHEAMEVLAEYGFAEDEVLAIFSTMLKEDY